MRLRHRLSIALVLVAGMGVNVVGSPGAAASAAPGPGSGPGADPSPGPGIDRSIRPAASAEVETAIIGGTPASAEAWPAMVALVDARIANPLQGQFCGGSLISETWVLTAGHCVDDASPADVQILGGTVTLVAGSGERVGVNRIVVHPGYDPRSQVYDIALVELARRPSGSSPIRIAGASEIKLTNPGTVATVLGWGLTSVTPSLGDYPSRLQEATLPIQPGASCVSTLGTAYVDDLMVCAGTPTRNTCLGDSGGPLLARTIDGQYVAVGVTSFGPCDAAAAYTKVSANASWITTTITTPAIAPRTVALVATSGGTGYWTVDDDATIAAFGDAMPFPAFGSALTQPVVAATRTPSGSGLWLVANDGGIFAYGDARFHGSTGNIKLNQPIVGMAPTPTGNGYWLVANDGGIFAYGDARFHGSA